MKKIIFITLFMGALVAMCCFSLSKKNEKLEYPVPPEDSTTYEAFGIKIDDRYRPLENDTASSTIEWVKAENEVTENYLKQIPFREDVRKRLTELNSFTKQGLPWIGNDGKYYYYRNDGLENQAVLYRADNAEGEGEEIFINPNALSNNGTVALTGVYQNRDGSKTAYTISRKGSDWTEIYVMDTASKNLLPDHIKWAKFTGASWHGDGFYYSAYPKPETGKEYSAANECHSVFFHKLGTPQEEDVLIFEDKDAPLHFHQGWVSDDESVMFISVSGQGRGNALMAKDLRNPDSDWKIISDSQDKDMSPIDAIDGTVYLYTSLDAPKYRLVKFNISAPEHENWVDVLPEDQNVLSGVRFADGKLIATYSVDVADRAVVFDLDGNKLRDITLPTYGAVVFSSRRERPEVFYAFSSFAYPSARYVYDLATGVSRRIENRNHDEIDFDPEDYVTEQVFYPSKDGTKIPMFLTYKKGLVRNGKNPVYLYGYGGFNVSLPPGFSPNRVLWLENGGVYAQTNLRGGGEYGERWHEAGTKMKKQNVFDDFIAAAEYLISEKWTEPDLLAIEGGSNGGLLIGAVVNQRPDLFSVAIPRVGVMDMMRYHLFTIGWNWASDYGTAEDSPEMAKYLYEYSPLHNIQSGSDVNYPAIMITTADHDDRVVPAHSFKYAAALQAAETGNRPKIIRIDSDAGHGAGKPMSKVIDEYTDIYSFIMYNMGLHPKRND